LWDVSVYVQGNGQGAGRLVAVGDSNGTVALLEVSHSVTHSFRQLVAWCGSEDAACCLPQTHTQVCQSLAESQPSEKPAIAAMFDREFKQEKNLEIRERDLRRAKVSSPHRTTYTPTGWPE
jgi:dynein intermediate chain 2, axonemal